MAAGAGKAVGRWGAVGAIALSLAACEVPQPVEPTLKPQQRPARAAPAAPVVAQPTSAESASLRSYYNQVLTSKTTQGLLRQDGGGADTPFSANILARNFEQIAFFNEYDGSFSGSGGPSPLRRWEQPVSMGIVFGAGVPPSERANAQSRINSFAARLSRVTRHPISVGGRPNFMVVIAGEDDRAAALQDASSRVAGLSSGSLRALGGLPRDTFCAVAAYAGGQNPNVYTAAVAVIRAENPDLLRLSCIHEELAQGLGLANDSPAARPSIFNDDDEFALLTRHDELLLQMLYDERLTPGMTAAQARPIVRILAREATGGPI